MAELDTTSPEVEEQNRPVSAQRRPAVVSYPGRKKLERRLKIALAIVALVSLVEALTFSGTYLLHSRYYVTTDNAQVDGDKVEINAPVTGILTDWSISQGSAVEQNQVVGRVQGVGSGARPKRPIRSPSRGTIAVNNVVDGQYVTAGTTLATAYDPATIYVTARVKETEIAEVSTGQRVDITVDAFPDASIVGQVTQIQQATAGEFTIFPDADTDPTNPQKVDQYVPVKIALLSTSGVALAPGMNVLANIHKP
jgi:multidrug resistance efflux pump